MPFKVFVMQLLLAILGPVLSDMILVWLQKWRDREK